MENTPISSEFDGRQEWPWHWTWWTLRKGFAVVGVPLSIIGGLDTICSILSGAFIGQAKTAMTTVQKWAESLPVVGHEQVQTAMVFVGVTLIAMSCWPSIISFFNKHLSRICLASLGDPTDNSSRYYRAAFIGGFIAMASGIYASNTSSDAGRFALAAVSGLACFLMVFLLSKSTVTESDDTPSDREVSLGAEVKALKEELEIDGKRLIRAERKAATDDENHSAAVAALNKQIAGITSVQEKLQARNEKLTNDLSAITDDRDTLKKRLTDVTEKAREQQMMSLLAANYRKAMDTFNVHADKRPAWRGGALLLVAAFGPQQKGPVSK